MTPPSSTAAASKEVDFIVDVSGPEEREVYARGKDERVSYIKNKGVQGSEKDGGRMEEERGWR